MTRDDGRGTPVDRTGPSETESLAFEFDLPHPPEKVWRALTEPELLAEWLLPVAGLELEPGATFRFEAEPTSGWDGIVRWLRGLGVDAVKCRMLEIEAERKLSYRWVVGDPGDDFFLDTVVTFTLTPTASGTRLTLVQSGFEPEQKRNFAGARYGWRMMGEKLVDLLARLP
ncbi:MAG: SRPBCC family protein [Gemmatimonadota bacterium]